MNDDVKTYLGDSVYAEIVGSMIKLTTDNGLGPTNEIYLEDEVFAALCRFAGIDKPKGG